MHIKKIFSSLLLAGLVCMPLSAFADEEECDPSDVQCTYFTGSAKGKYLKVTLAVGGTEMTVIDCFDETTTLSIDQDAVKNGHLHVGDTVVEKFRQCKDAACKTDVNLTESSFVIKQDGANGYIAVPKFIAVNMHEDYGVSCKLGFKRARLNQFSVKHKQ